jgi:hypothetical protein
MSKLVERLRKRLPARPRAALDLLYESDQDFQRLYERGLAATGTPDVVVDGYPKRFVRFYNTVQYFEASRRAEGAVIECGCWRGLSMFLFASLERRRNPGFRGAGFTVVDSFEGLAAPGEQDARSLPQGSFACEPEVVQRNLAEFPEIRFVKGWIPGILTSLPETAYRFVHVDVDHYAPIAGALEYFVPRLAPGGILVVDDYGSRYFPGARQAVEEYAARSASVFVGLSSGQAVLWR